MSTISKKWKNKQKLTQERFKERQRESSRRWYSQNSSIKKQKSKQYYHKRRDNLIKQMGGKCEFCNQVVPNNEFNIHHKVPMVVFENKLSHYFKNIDIMMLLCNKCHVMWHNVMDDLKIDDIWKDSSVPDDFYDRMY
jgi:hypothetical protein